MTLLLVFVVNILTVVIIVAMVYGYVIVHFMREHQTFTAKNRFPRKLLLIKR